MGTMTSIRKDNWAPSLLVAPDGRTYTPGSYREYRQLLASGYREAPAESPPSVPDVAAVSAAADDPDVKLAFDAQQARDAAESAAESAAAATAAAEAPKTKTSRRSGGAQ